MRSRSTHPAQRARTRYAKSAWTAKAAGPAGGGMNGVESVSAARVTAKIQNRARSGFLPRT